MTPTQRALFIKTRDKVLSLPEAPNIITGCDKDYWRQSNWFSSEGDESVLNGYCGTCACFAGWAVHELDPRVNSLDSFGEIFGDDTDIDLFALEAMGLSGREGANLFLASNTRDDITRICDEILQAHDNDPGDTHE